MQVSRYLNLMYLQRRLQDEIEAHQAQPSSEISELCNALSCLLQPKIDALYADIHDEISSDITCNIVMTTEFYDDITYYSLPVIDKKH